MESQPLEQHRSSNAQTNVTHGSQAGLRAAPVVQTSWAQLPPMHGPQSPGQVMHDSPPPMLQTPSPQTTHGPQSPLQFMHVSPALHMPSPQTGPPPLELLLELPGPLPLLLELLLELPEPLPLPPSPPAPELVPPLPDPLEVDEDEPVGPTPEPVASPPLPPSPPLVSPSSVSVKTVP